jgi:replicative DNA helicase
MSGNPFDQLNPESSEHYLVSLLQPITTRVLRDEALSTVDPDEFWSGAYAGLWSAARRLHAADKTINRRSLIGALTETGATPGALDVANRILTKMAGLVPPAEDFGQAVAEVRRCGQLRLLLEACDGIKQQAVTAEDPAQALSIAYDLLAKLDQGGDQSDVVRYSSLLDGFIEEQNSPDMAVVIPTPWIEVNRALNGGIRGGRMYVVGARPGDGKSIAAHQIAQGAAELGYPALVFSAEMGASEVTGRMVANGALVEQDHIISRTLNRDSWRRVNEYIDRARHWSISVVDKSNLTMSYIKAVCRNEKRRNNTAVVVLDYLQLVGGDSRGQMREQEVSAISRQVKQLSRELDVAFIVAAQLNRENVRHNRKPIMADLRESGGIEADADVVMLHSRPLVEDGPRKGEPGLRLLVDIVKNRHGRVGPIELDWRPHYATIGSAQELIDINEGA